MPGYFFSQIKKKHLLITKNIFKKITFVIPILIQNFKIDIALKIT